MNRVEGARAAIARAQDKLDRLRTVQPFLIDLSLRENPVGARVGQTLADKQALLPQLRSFGFQNILLGTLDYADPDEPEVDDDFLQWINASQPGQLAGGWVFTDIGIDDGTGWKPSPSMSKAVFYNVPNVFLEIYLAEMPYTFAQLQAWLSLSINWLNANLSKTYGPPQIIINIVDGCDAFYSNFEQTCTILDQIRDSGVLGLSFEDDRGTYFPFQVGSYVEIARSYLPDQKILVHMHAGGGFENASLIEAILAGADGVWGGLPKPAAIIGHASLGELLANLIRAGNANIPSSYRVTQLADLNNIWQYKDDLQQLENDLPIFGFNAYRTPLSFFEQKAGRDQDLPAAVVGAVQQYRICPVVSDPPVIAGRLGQVMQRDPKTFDPNVLWQMRRLMRRSLREGNRIPWDEPQNLEQLYKLAGGK